MNDKITEQMAVAHTVEVTEPATTEPVTGEPGVPSTQAEVSCTHETTEGEKVPF